MTHGWLRLESAIRVPGEALGDEVDKELVFALEDLGECAGGRTAAFALGIDEGTRCASSIYVISEGSLYTRSKTYRRKASSSAHD